MDWRAAVRDGVYPIAFAAKMAEATNSTVASWFRSSNGSQLPPAIITHFEPVRGQLLLPFLALVEARFVARFRKHGLSLQTIRKVARKLRDAYKLEHPFAERRFRTDGRKVMMEEAADDGERRLIDIMTDEFGFPSVIEPLLFDTVVYIDDIAARLKPLPATFRPKRSPRPSSPRVTLMRSPNGTGPTGTRSLKPSRSSNGWPREDQVRREHIDPFARDARRIRAAA